MRWWILAGIGSIVVLVSGYWLIARSNAMDQTACADHSHTVVAFGDSLIVGYGATDGKGVTTLLSQKLQVPVKNLGRNGDTTARARERLNEVIQERPDVVIVLLGGNDALQRVPVSETKENLAAIIDTLQGVSSTRIRVVLVGVLGSPFNDPYRPMFDELGRTPGVTYVPNVLSGIFGNRSLMSDEIHPNDEGYAQVADRIYPAVLTACAS